MIEAITITDNEVYTTKWNGDIRQYEKQLVEPENLLNYLWERVSFEGNVTLGRLFSLIETEKELWELFLREHVGPLVDEIKVPYSSKTENPNEKVDYLELSWWAEVECYNGEKSFNFNFPNFHGIGTCQEDQLYGYKKGETITWAMGFTPVNEMKDLPVRLNTKVELFTQSYDKVDGKYPETEKTYLGEKHFTLLEVIKGIFYELTWYGVPEKRDALKDHLEQEMKGIEDGTIPTVPWQDFDNG